MFRVTDGTRLLTVDGDVIKPWKCPRDYIATFETMEEAQEAANRYNNWDHPEAYAVWVIDKTHELFNQYGWDED